MLNALRYLARTSCGWCMLPVNFPAWQTVYWWFRRFVRLFLFRTIHDLALMISTAKAMARLYASTLGGSSIRLPTCFFSKNAA